MKNLIKTRFSHYSAVKLWALNDKVIKCMTDNPDFAGCQDALIPLKKAGGELSGAISDAKGGGTKETEILKNKKAAIIPLLDKLASDVEFICKGDRGKAIGSGFDMTKEKAEKKGKTEKVLGVEAEANRTSGIIDVSWAEDKNRVMYLIEKAVVIEGAIPQFVTAGFTTCIKFKVKGLTPGLIYQFRIISINNLGLSDPSDIATAMSL